MPCIIPGNFQSKNKLPVVVSQFPRIIFRPFARLEKVGYQGQSCLRTKLWRCSRETMEPRTVRCLPGRFEVLAAWSLMK